MFCLYTSSSSKLSPHNLIFQWSEGDGIEFRLPFKIFSILPGNSWVINCPTSLLLSLYYKNGTYSSGKVCLLTLIEAGDKLFQSGKSKSQALFHQNCPPQDYNKRTLGGASTRFKCCNFAAWYVTGKKNSFTDCYGPHFRLPTACNLLGPGCSSPAPPVLQWAWKRQWGDFTPQECNLGHKHWKIAPEAVPLNWVPSCSWPTVGLN